MSILQKSKWEVINPVIILISYYIFFCSIFWLEFIHSVSFIALWILGPILGGYSVCWIVFLLLACYLKFYACYIVFDCYLRPFVGKLKNRWYILLLIVYRMLPLWPVSSETPSELPQKRNKFLLVGITGERLTSTVTWFPLNCYFLYLLLASLSGYWQTRQFFSSLF